MLSALLKIFFIPSGWLLFLTPVYGQTLSLESTRRVQEERDLEGVYAGYLNLVDGKIVSLEATIIRVGTSSDGVVRFSGGFVVDNEGGPYGFNQIIYNPSERSVEMTYLKSRGTPSAGAVSMRFAGSRDSEGIIQGTVESIFRGYLGTFVLRQQAGRRKLEAQSKYVGRWEGKADFLFTGKLSKVSLVVAPLATTISNPLDWELDFSKGKVGSLFLSPSNQISFREITTDYFSQRMILTSDERGSLLQLSLDIREKNELVGEIISSRYGRTATLRLIKTGSY